MPSLLIKIMMFLSSYAPLGLIMCVMSFKVNFSLSMIFLGISVASVAVLAFYLAQLRTMEPVNMKTVDVRRGDGETMSYIVTYLIPFMLETFEPSLKSAGLLLFFFVIAILYVNSGMLHINPTMNLLGWHIYGTTGESGQEYCIITERRLRKQQELKVISIAEDVFVEIEK